MNSTNKVIRLGDDSHSAFQLLRLFCSLNKVKMRFFSTLLITLLFSFCSIVHSQEKFVFPTANNPDYFPLINNNQPIPVISDTNDDKGVLRAVNDLKDDFRKVTGNLPAASGNTAIIVGTVGK